MRLHAHATSTKAQALHIRLVEFVYQLDDTAVLTDVLKQRRLLLCHIYL